MYLDLTEGIEVSDTTQWQKSQRFEIYWEGFVFVKGQQPGKTSIRSFVKKLERLGPHQASAILSGSFVCLVQDKESGTWYAFTDGSRSKPLFYTKDTVCSSFLELAKRNHFKGSNMDPFCVVEFILTGFQFSDKIFFNQIKVLDAHEILEVTPGLSITLKHRAWRDPFQEELFSDSVAAFLNVMEKIVKSIRDSELQVSVDLTGGTDTRLTAAILDYFGLEFETAVSGTPNHPDVQIGAKVARTLESSHTFHPVFHEVRPTFLWNEPDRSLSR